MSQILLRSSEDCNICNVSLITGPSAKTLGKWAGLHIGSSCVVVEDYGEDSEALHKIQKHLQPN